MILMATVLSALHSCVQAGHLVAHVVELVLQVGGHAIYLVSGVCLVGVGVVHGSEHLDVKTDDKASQEERGNADHADISGDGEKAATDGVHPPQPTHTATPVQFSAYRPCPDCALDEEQCVCPMAPLWHDTREEYES